MPDLPASLALTNIADGSTMTAAPVRNNYSAIQTAVNAVIAALSGGTADQALIATDTDTVSYKYPPGYEYDYAQITAPVTVSGTSAAQTTVITGSAVTYDGVTAVYIEAFLPQITTGSADQVVLELWEGATSIGIIGIINTSTGTKTGTVLAKKKLTPTAAAHTYTLKAWRTTNNGTITVGAGTAGVQVPGFLRVVKA